MHSQTEILRRVVKDHMRPPPPALRPGTPVREAVERLSEAASLLVLVSDGAERPLGVLSLQDVARRVVWRVSPDNAVEAVMTRPVITAEAGDCVLRAVAVMRERRLSRLPVVDEAGRAVGLLTLEDALAAMAGPAMDLVEMITGDDSIEGWRRAKAAQVDLAERLLGDEMPVPDIQALLTDLNADLHRRVLAHTIAEVEANGWGPPPARYSLIVMGSGGRGENYLAPDQDNGLIIADYPDEEHARVDGYFLEVARRMVERLDRIGFELCKGNVMAVNPVWRKRLTEWREQVATWIRKRATTHLLQADILFDFRHVAGDPALARELRTFVTGSVASSPRFVRDLLGIEHDHRVALGWFGFLSKEEDEDSRPGLINLKMRGTLPLVEAARILSLRAGVDATSTRGRLDALAARGILNPADHDYLIGAYTHITRLLLRNQIADFRAGRPMTDYVPEAQLTRREKDYLVSCFRAIEALRGTLSEEVGA